MVWWHVGSHVWVPRRYSEFLSQFKHMDFRFLVILNVSPVWPPLYVSSMKYWWPLQGIPHLSHYDSWDRFDPHLDPEQLSYIMPLWPAWGMKVDKWASKKKKGKTLSLNCPQFVVKKKKKNLCQHTTKSWWCSRFEILPKCWAFLQLMRYISCPDSLILPAIHSFFSYNLFYLASGSQQQPAPQATCW